MINIIITIFGGITLFLFGLNIFKSSLFNITNNRLKNLLSRFVKNNFRAFLLGIITTAIMQSSSGITAISIVLLSNNLLDLKSTILIILGANIGTCITPFIFTFNIGKYSLLFIIVGYFFSILKKNKFKFIGNIIISLGLIFLGLNFLDNGLDNLSKNIFLTQLLSISKSGTLSLLISTTITTLLQSSSATIAITQSLYQAKIITLTNAIFFMLGANIGTTISSFSYANSLNNEAKIAVKINIILNILGSLVFIIFLKPYTNFLIRLEKVYSLSKELTIAYSHLIFNIISSFVIFIFFNQLYNLLTKKFFRVDTNIKIC